MRTFAMTDLPLPMLCNDVIRVCAARSARASPYPEVSGPPPSLGLVPLRRTAALVLVGVSVLSGCKYGAALSKREAVVIFKPAPPRLSTGWCWPAAVTSPTRSPSRWATARRSSELASNVRYRIDKIDDANLNKLVLCIQQFDFVQTYDIPDTSH